MEGVARHGRAVTVTGTGSVLALTAARLVDHGIGLILFFVIWMLSGAAPPRAVLPQRVQDAGELNPLTHVVIAIQDPWFGYGWNGEMLLILVLVTLAAAGVGLRGFRWG